MKSLLNDQPFVFSENNLPCLVSYGDKIGGSHFSVVLLADLFASGSKILFLTAYPMATDNFLSQVGELGLSIARVESDNNLSENKDAQAIMIKSGDEELFMKAVELLDDVEQRVIFVKNIEGLKSGTIRRCLEFDKVILSGDIDKCDLGGEIIQKHFNTTVLFNQPKVTMGFKVPELERYSGYMWSNQLEGVVRTEMG